MHILNTNAERKEVKSLKFKCVKRRKENYKINTKGNEKRIEDKPKANRKQQEPPPPVNKL